jgi:hypothetical protein
MKAALLAMCIDSTGGNVLAAAELLSAPFCSAHPVHTSLNGPFCCCCTWLPYAICLCACSCCSL